jgi:hypothetical protein
MMSSCGGLGRWDALGELLGPQEDPSSKEFLSLPAAHGGGELLINQLTLSWGAAGAGDDMGGVGLPVGRSRNPGLIARGSFQLVRFVACIGLIFGLS